MNRELLLDNGGETEWQAYSINQVGEIEYHEFTADGLGEAEKICQQRGWILDDDYWIPKMIFW